MALATAFAMAPVMTENKGCVFTNGRFFKEDEVLLWDTAAPLGLVERHDIAMNQHCTP